ncbi:MAG: tRNA 2-thiouridine(34) synthase MnmA [Gemmatimonas sp.]
MAAPLDIAPRTERAVARPSLDDLGVADLAPGSRVAVAMSGGVDSSTVAALLAEAGFDVVGVTLQLYDSGVAKGKPGTCCAGSDIHDARAVARHIGVPHYVLDFESRFKADVIEPFAESYARGETPIPCVACNRTVKFRDLLAIARDLGAAALATGHYARRVVGANGPELHAAADAGRDQSYFLFATRADELAYLRFPLGGAPNKAATRAHAARLGIAIADKPDSQDICFVPNGDYANVVAKLRPDAIEPGDIVHVDGRVLGRHDGIIHFTVGQRRGVGVGGVDGASSERLYVVRVEPDARRVVVGPREALATATARVVGLNWLGDGEATPGRTVAGEVKIRSAQTPVAATVTFADGGEARVAFAAAEFGVAPGQACVVYDGPRVLGGGFIARN